MTAYLVIVWLLLPGTTAQEPKIELHREYITASSASACNAHAQKREAEQREKHSATVQRLKAKVVGVCAELLPVKE